MAEATDKKAADETPAHTVPSFPVERIVAESGDFLGVPSHVVAGALADESKKNLTLAEAKDAVRAFEKREVEIDNPVGSNNIDEEERD